jgi:hypothetical protein
MSSLRALAEAAREAEARFVACSGATLEREHAKADLDERRFLFRLACTT